MQKILITGSTGLLGSYLTKYLKKRKFKITKFKRKGLSKLSNIHFCEKYFKKNNYDKIINLSAITNIDYCEKNKLIAKEVNFTLIKNICNVIKKLKRKTHIIQLSTDQFYDSFKTNTENKKKCVNYYTKTKLMAEKVCLKSNCTILRTNFVGKSLALGRTSFSDWIYYSIKNKKFINLAGDIMFSPLSIKTLSKIIVIIIKKPIRGLYNVGSIRGLSKLNFAKNFSKKVGLNTDYIYPVTYKKIKFFAKRNKDMRMQVKKFEKKFNFKFNSLNFELAQIASEYKRSK